MTSLDAQLAARNRPHAVRAGSQRWNDLLFLHWQVDPRLVQSTLPAGLTADTFQGAAYLGIVPFFMERVRPRILPPIPLLSWFLELNVRTYVHDAEGRPGVMFYSLDCNQPLAVSIARKVFRLPYFDAQMAAVRKDGRVDYCCRRNGASGGTAVYSWQTEIGGREAEIGSLEFFLVERYYLFTTGPEGWLYSGRVHHRPYRIRPAVVSAYSTLPAEQAGFQLEGPPVSALGAGAVDVSVFPIERCPSMI